MSTKKEQVKKHAKKAVNVGLGVVQLVGEQVNSILGSLEKEGHINRAEGKRMAKSVLAEANKFQKKISGTVDKKVKKVVNSSSTKSTPQRRTKALKKK
jgi:polyhydroxyalkanoate synthesis regulator phasin